MPPARAPRLSAAQREALAWVADDDRVAALVREPPR